MIINTSRRGGLRGYMPGSSPLPAFSFVLGFGGGALPSPLRKQGKCCGGCAQGKPCSKTRKRLGDSLPIEEQPYYTGDYGGSNAPPPGISVDAPPQFIPPGGIPSGGTVINPGQPGYLTPGSPAYAAATTAPWTALLAPGQPTMPGGAIAAPAPSFLSGISSSTLLYGGLGLFVVLLLSMKRR
jgi:hypothetical protein